ncbi:cytochrome b/b6 domain-containing protein [Geodermatophilus sp. YIM 151500]|uniref:cytochrome b n=1 Tax=Geodermatophilus sp. YIM 151500 TaxID=2984531 RepID=UPI0021E4439C|nr:cytochrome b/b6 domain-containing protein [Geodermatophilus sp. YIM 151500]MCV2489978.1 cytochrome b/b6 domain-containing protein [Geodermatophilus sp. YIM 151500]
MHLRTGAHGYGVVTEALRWLTVAALGTQVFVGYAMDVDHAPDGERKRLDAEAERREEAAEQQGEAAEERAEAEPERLEAAVDARRDDEASAVFGDVVTGDAFADGLSLPELHVLLGLFVIALALTRILWRRTTPLPPSAEHLSAGERRLEGRLEKVMLALLVVVPASGLLLVAGGDGWLAVQVAAHFAFLAAVACHVGLVLNNTVFRRNRHLARML